MRCYYKYMSAIRLNGLLENQTIRFTQPGLFNDPFEMPAMIAAQEERDLWKLIGETTGGIFEHATRRPTEINPDLLGFPAKVIAGTFRPWAVSPELTGDEKREVDERRKIIGRIREIDQTFGILSLTVLSDNLLMWAHYADEHRGAVVEIETSDPAFLEPDPDRQDPREVRYSRRRPHLSIDDRVLLDVFFTKSPQWEYEQEYRIVRRLEHATRIKPKPPIGFDLRLMSSMKDVDDIPTAGKNLFIVADVTNGLHFRIFDGDGKLVVDTDETRLTEQARQIEDLRKQLEGLWPPHEITWSDKDRIATAVTSIVDHTPIYVFPCPNRCLRSIILGQRFSQNRPDLVASVRKHLDQPSMMHVALSQAWVDRAEYYLQHEKITPDQVGEDVALVLKQA